MHIDTNQKCDLASYRGRGWTRLDQWAHISIGGLKNMYLYDGESVEKGAAIVPFRENQELLTDAINPMGGNFSYDSDKHTIVDPMLGLWAAALEKKPSSDQKNAKNAETASEDDVGESEHIVALIEANKE